jgi:hypothetical protein
MYLFLLIPFSFQNALIAIERRETGASVSNRRRPGEKEAVGYCSGIVNVPLSTI